MGLVGTNWDPCILYSTPFSAQINLPSFLATCQSFPPLLRLLFFMVDKELYFFLWPRVCKQPCQTSFTVVLVWVKFNGSGLFIPMKGNLNVTLCSYIWTISFFQLCVCLFLALHDNTNLHKTSSKKKWHSHLDWSDFPDVSDIISYLLVLYNEERKLFCR